MDSHFHPEFKAITGQTPEQYAKEHETTAKVVTRAVEDAEVITTNTAETKAEPKKAPARRRSTKTTKE